MAITDDGSGANSKFVVWQFCIQHPKQQTVKTENQTENRRFFQN